MNLGILLMLLRNILMLLRNILAVVVAGCALFTLRAQEQPRWYKGNLHTHSFWSDGDDYPEMIADWYKRSGYQFLALSDHNILSEGDRWIDAAPDDTTKGKALTKYI